MDQKPPTSTAPLKMTRGVEMPALLVMDQNLIVWIQFYLQLTTAMETLVNYNTVIV